RRMLRPGFEDATQKTILTSFRIEILADRVISMKSCTTTLIYELPAVHVSTRFRFGHTRNFRFAVFRRPVLVTMKWHGHASPPKFSTVEQDVVRAAQRLELSGFGPPRSWCKTN